MITDVQLYGVAVFLGSAAMLLILLYHFLEVNATDNIINENSKGRKSTEKSKS